MKKFLGSWIMSSIIVYMFLFFGAFGIFNNLWAAVLFIGFLVAVFVSILLYFENKIEDLKKRIEELEESKKEDRE